MTMAFNVAERCKQYRAVQARIKEMETAHAEAIKPFKDFLKQADDELLVYLNQSGQKSAATPEGTAYWSALVTFSVEDKDAFRRHVIGTEQWELIKWAAAATPCEAFTEANKEPPPGVVRSSIRKVHVIAPSKPRKKVVKAAQPEPSEGEAQAPAAEEFEAMGE
jgi:succinate dehydrogenase flavin-adding protein (antitoxin of CptAB toxin-antitoxin module)